LTPLVSFDDRRSHMSVKKLTAAVLAVVMLSLSGAVTTAAVADSKPPRCC